MEQRLQQQKKEQGKGMLRALRDGEQPKNDRRYVCSKCKMKRLVRMVLGEIICGECLNQEVKRPSDHVFDPIKIAGIALASRLKRERAKKLGILYYVVGSDRTYPPIKNTVLATNRN